jgi:hypothetical protein
MKKIGIGSVTVFGKSDDKALFAIVKIGVAIIDVIVPSVVSLSIFLILIPKSFRRICFAAAR